MKSKIQQIIHAAYLPALMLLAFRQDNGPA